MPFEQHFINTSHIYHDGKVHGVNMGPIWGQQEPGGPYVGPLNFAIWLSMHNVLTNLSSVNPTFLKRFNKGIPLTPVLECDLVMVDSLVQQHISSIYEKKNLDTCFWCPKPMYNMYKI